MDGGDYGFFLKLFYYYYYYYFGQFGEVGGMANCPQEDLAKFG